MSSYVAQRAALLQSPEGFGPERRRALTSAADRWLSGLLAEALLIGGGARRDPGVALVAVGGYGRGELVHGSDLDVLMLHLPGVEVAAVADSVWYPVWDAGVKLDHSVRTVEQARRVAQDDLRAVLGMLDIRHIAGDVTLTDRLRSAVLADWRNAAPKRLPELAETARTRADSHGEVAFLLEPDLKESRGGLRDVVALRGVQASWVTDPPHGALRTAHARLLDVRDALHATTGRAGDRLVLQEQPAVARVLGLQDRDALLREVAQAGRAVGYASDVTWRRVQQVLSSRGRISRWRPGGGRPDVSRRPLAEGVVEYEGEAVLARDADPARDPLLVLRAMAAAAQAGLPLAPGTVERFAADAPPIPEPWPASARDELVRLLGAGQAAIPVWEALDLAGVISRLIPEWERLRCLPQHNPVHRFTVDRHLIETAANAAGLARRVARPDLLLVAALFHDIGKGLPGDHSIEGVPVIQKLLPRLGFPREDVDAVATLVRHHLLLPRIATRFDLEDPATLDAVVEHVDSLDTLELLSALTESDALAAGPAAWTPWRSALVEELVVRVSAVLRGRPLPPPPELSPAQRELAREGVIDVLVEPGEEVSTITVVAQDQLGLLAAVAGVFGTRRLTVRSATTESVGSVAVTVWMVAPEYGSLPDAALLRTDVRLAMEGSLDLAERLGRREAAYMPRPGIAVPPPRVEIVHGASAAATVIEVRAHDRPGLLYRIGRALADARVDVRSAKVSTLGAEAIDVFYVIDHETGDPLTDARAREVADAVDNALGDQDSADRI